MPSLSRKAPRLAYAAVLAALCLVAWVAKATLAQDQPSEPAALPLPQAIPASSLPQGLDVPRVDAVQPAAGPGQSPSPLGGSHGYTIPTRPEDPPIVPTAVPAQGPTILQRTTDERAEDPEKAALAFVEQNQKMAESQLVMLRAEEARLRARLQKVEAGIKRWDSLLGALKQSQGTVAVMIPSSPQGWKQAASPERDSEPQHLDPVSPSDVKPSAVTKK